MFQALSRFLIDDVSLESNHSIYFLKAVFIITDLAFDIDLIFIFPVLTFI